MQPIKIFLASSVELKADRDAFEIFIGRKNKDWVARGAFLELVLWEDFLDTLSATRLQDEYNQAIRKCDLFVMLFATKVGRYTEEEFETAIGQFKATRKPFILTYFKDAPISSGLAGREDLASLWAFQDKLKALGHFLTEYRNVEQLLLHFSGQLDKLAANGFIEFKRDPDPAPPGGGNSHQATLTGSGAIAQGEGSIAIGAGGVSVGGSNSGVINTGTQIDTGGGAYVGGNLSSGRDFIARDRVQSASGSDLAPLFAPLLAAIARQAPVERKAEAVRQVEQLKSELAKGERADDGRVGKLVDGLAALVPGAAAAVVSLFATPILSGLAGPVTKYVLDKIKGS